MSGRLKNLKIHEVSLVDLAANNRDFIILKSKDTQPEAEQLSLNPDEDKLMSFLTKLRKDLADKKTKADNEDRKKASPDAEYADAEAVDEEKNRLRKNGDDEVLQKIYQLLTDYLLEEDNEQDEDDDLEEVLDNEDSRSTLLMNKNKMNQNPNPELHKLLKSQSDILKAQHIELAKAKAEITLLTQEAEERKKQAFIEKAKSLQILGVDDQFGLVLKSLSEKTPKEYEKLMATLIKAADSLSKTEYLDEIGNGFNRDSQNSVAIVQENARAIQKDKGLTHEQAVMKALEGDPSLYDAYLKEMRNGI